MGRSSFTESNPRKSELCPFFQLTSYGYDGLDHVRFVSVKVLNDKPQTTKYDYGAQFGTFFSGDFLTQISYPNKDSGAASTLSQDQEVYKVDLLGDVLTKKNPNGVSHDYRYDVLGRQAWDFATVTVQALPGGARVPSNRPFLGLGG